MTSSLSFSNFQFKTIGQQPELLRRISAPNPEDLDRSHSPSISPVLPKELPSDSSPELSTQPSLGARLSLADRLMINLNDNNDVQMEDVSSDQPTSLHARSLTTPAINLASTNQSLNMGVTAGTAVAASGRSHNTMNVSDVPLPHHSHNSPSPLGLQPSNLSRSSSGHFNPGINFQTSVRPSSLQSNEAASISRPGTPNNSAASLITEVFPFATLRQLQARIASSMASLKPVSTENILLLAQSLKEQQKGILTSVHSAQTIAQQALDSAQASVTACLNCLKVAESTQVQIDEVMAAIENIGGHASSWNVGLEALRDDFGQLKAWARDLEINEAQRQRDFKETETKRRSQERTPQPQGPTTKRLGRSLTRRPTQSPVISPNLSPPSSVPISVEHEADAAARAWDQLREQSTERRRLAEAELRKHREAEQRLEQEQKQAQALVEAREAELAHKRAERIEAERREKARQQKEAEEAELKRKEIDRMREEAIQFQLARRKASEERRYAEENTKVLQAEKDMAAKRFAEEQKRRDIEARETLARRREGERMKAAEAEAQRQHLLQEQEVKRQEIVAQKHRANAEAAKKIHAERAKGKQANRIASIDKSISPPHQNTPLPPPRQSTTAANFSKFDLGNTSTTSAAGRLDDKSTGASANFQSGDTSTPLRIPTPPKVCRADLQPPDSLSGLNPANNVVKGTDPNLSNQLKYVSATQRQRSASIANGSTAFHEYDSWVVPSTSPQQPATIAFVNSIGSDIGIIPLIPRSLVPPISPEAQRANLRRLTNGLSSPIKRNPDEGKLVKEMERNFALPLKVKESTNVLTTSNPPVELGLRKPKEEPPIDIPLLSLPSPSPSKHIKVASICQPLHSEPARARSQNPSQQKQFDASGPAVGNIQPSTQPTTGSINTTSTAVDISTTSSTGEEQVTVVPKTNIVSLPRPPLSIPMNQNLSSIPHDLAPNDPFDNLLASRMGPDASISTNGWSIPSPVHEDAPDFRFRARAARSPGLDHYSPSPSPVNTRGTTRSRAPRRVDHYSPSRRAPECQLPAHNDYARSRSRSGGSSGNHSRGSPDPRTRHLGRRDDGPADILPPNLLGLKRQRVDEQPGGPPTRRPRFGPDINNESAPRNDTARLPYSSHQPEDEWSHLANYERSPTPELRATPLFNRIEDPSPGFRGGQASNSYRPDSQNDRRPGFKQHAASQGQLPYSNYPYHSNNPQRQNYRNPEDGSRPNLLNRFTDSAQPAQVADGRPPPRSYRGRPQKPFGRGGTHPPLEQRLSNNPNNPSLMTRMQGPTGYQRPNNA